MWPHGSAITSQILDAEYQVDSKIMGNFELISTGIKLLQNLVWTTLSSMELSQNSQWEPLWVRSNQHLVTALIAMPCNRL